MTTSVSHLAIRHPRTFWIGMPLLALLLAGNFAEHQHRQSTVRAAAGAGAVVVTAETSAAGHTSIGIDEHATATDLSFALLGQWDYRSSAPPPCPSAITAFSGRPCTITGFMYPLAQGDRVQVFCLLRSTQTCCFGPRPQYNQYLFVETREPVPFERLRPVRVSGRFVVDPQPGQGYIYCLEQAEVAAAGLPEPTVDPAAYAAAHGLRCLAWSDLGTLSSQDRQHPALPPALAALDGREVVVDGFVVQRDPGPPAQLVLGSHPPAGRPGGQAPTMFDAIAVTPAPGVALPPAWQQRTTWRGIVAVARDPKTWDDQGVVQLLRAEPCAAPPAGVTFDAGPLLPWWMAGVVVAGFLLFTLGRVRAPAAGTA